LFFSFVCFTHRRHSIAFLPEGRLIRALERTRDRSAFRQMPILICRDTKKDCCAGNVQPRSFSSQALRFTAAPKHLQTEILACVAELAQAQQRHSGAY